MEEFNNDNQNNKNDLDDFYTKDSSGDSDKSNNQLNSNTNSYNNDFNNDNKKNQYEPYPNPYLVVKQDKVPKWVIITVSIIMSLVLLIGGLVGGYFYGLKNRYTGEDMGLSNEIYQLIEDHYYKDMSRVDFDKAAALGVSSMLDDFSGLMLTDSYVDPLFGFSMTSDSRNYHYVNSVEFYSNAGITPGKLCNDLGEIIGNGEIPVNLDKTMVRGDMIFMINGINVAGLDRDVLSNDELLGDATSTFVVKRNINDVVYHISFDLEKSHFESRDAVYENMGNNVGMITLNSFAGINANDFEIAAKA